MKPEDRAAKWNVRHAVGCPVVYRMDDGVLFKTATRSEAQVLGGHTAVVWVDGVAGCVALDRVSSREE
jgi:hypothetical protein